MAISFIASAVGSSSPNTGTTVTLPGGMAADDLIIVVAGVGDTANNGMAAPTEGGYTRIGSATIYSNDVADCNLDAYYKFHNGSDTTVSFGAVGGTNASNAAVVMVFRGVKLVADGGPFDTTVNTASGVSTSNADPPSHNWSGASGVWTVIGAVTGHTGGSSATFTFPTGYTTNAAQRAHNDTTDVLVGVGYNTSPADPEDPGAFTAANIGTASDNAWAAITVSLAPSLHQTLSAGSPVVTFSAPTSTLSAEKTLSAGAPIVTFTAPPATLVESGGGVTLEAGAPVVTFSAPASTLVAATTLTAGAPTVTFTAPAATRLAELALAAGAPTVAFSAPTANLLIDWILAVGAPVVTFTAPSATLSGAVNYFEQAGNDMTTAYRDYLNSFYGTNNLDGAPLLARWMAENTAIDALNARKDLEDGCRGL